MKTTYLWPMVSLLLWATTGSAQTEQRPKEAYLLVASPSSLTIPRGQQDSVRLIILRSKSFKTGEALVAANPPKDAALDVKVKELPGDTGEYMVKITTTDETKSGEYNFVLNCTLRNKSKGIVLKLIID